MVAEDARRLGDSPFRWGSAGANSCSPGKVVAKIACAQNGPIRTPSPWRDSALVRTSGLPATLTTPPDNGIPGSTLGADCRHEPDRGPLRSDSLLSDTKRERRHDPR